MPPRHHLRFLLQQVIHFLFASQHLPLVIAQAVLVLFMAFVVASWFVGILHLIWKADPIRFNEVFSSLVVWVMGSKDSVSFSGSYHAGAEETVAFLTKVYLVTTIPVFIYDRLRKTPLSALDMLKRRLKWSGFTVLGIAVSCGVFEWIWPESTWMVLAGLAGILWVIIGVLSGYVFILQMFRDALLALFDNQLKIS